MVLLLLYKFLPLLDFVSHKLKSVLFAAVLQKSFGHGADVRTTFSRLVTSKHRFFHKLAVRLHSRHPQNGVSHIEVSYLAQVCLLLVQAFHHFMVVFTQVDGFLY